MCSSRSKDIIGLSFLKRLLTMREPTRLIKRILLSSTCDGQSCPPVNRPPKRGWGAVVGGNRAAASLISRPSNLSCSQGDFSPNGELCRTLPLGPGGFRGANRQAWTISRVSGRNGLIAG